MRDAAELRGAARRTKESSVTPFLQMTNISKTFPGVKALSAVDLEIRTGEVHAIAGENGAGKSTLMKILTGVFQCDPGGEIALNGELKVFHDSNDARAAGINIIYQELSTVANLTVAENIFLAREPVNRFGLIDGNEMNRAAARLLAMLGVELSPLVTVRDLSIGQQQMIEIAKAISYESRLIIMDEPTASLSHHEATRLMEIIGELKAQGIGIVYISHRLDEIFAIADRVTVLRDGATVDTAPISEMTRQRLVRAMVNRELSELYGEHASHATSDIVLSVLGLSDRHRRQRSVQVTDVSFDLRRGEILGFFGLIGAGRTEIMEMLFGIRPYTGEVRIDGAPVHILTPDQAIRHGLGFATEDRKEQGLVLNMSVRENFSLTHLIDYSRGGFVDKGREGRRCAEFVRSFRIKTPSVEQTVVNLSGGNQQKVVLSKWVVIRPKILIVDEPTRGIDVGAKSEVHALLREMAAQGTGVIVVSSDLIEIAAVSDRVVVIKNGGVAEIISRADVTQERVMAAATG